MQQRRRRMLLLAAGLAAVALYPYKSTVVPRWQFQFVDQDGNPRPHARVRQVWQHDSLGGSTHSEDSVTDANGYVTFPERTIRATVLRRALAAVADGISSVIPLSVHGSSGPHSFIVNLSGGGLACGDSYRGEGPPPERIVLCPP